MPRYLPVEIEKLALMGWRLAPITRARSGYFSGYVDQATSELDQLERWAHEYRGCNWTVIPQGSGIWALDVDVPSADHADDGVQALRSYVEANSPLPLRPHGRSGGGGHLLIFQDTGEPVHPRSGWPCSGLDPKSGRCGFTVPPSIHRRGGRYHWLVAPWEIKPPAAPGWLLKLVAPPPEKPRPVVPTFPTTDRALRRLRYAVEAIISAAPGTRNDNLNKQAYSVARHVAAGKLGYEQALGTLYAAAIESGLSARESNATIKSGFANGMRNPIESRH